MTSNSLRGWVFVAALGVATPALAGPSAQDLETARTLYKEGKELRAAGNLKGAFEKLKAAHALGHTPLTAIELARTEVQLGMFVEARETCLGVARMAIESDETARSAEARTESAKLADELRPRIASVRIHVSAPQDTTPIVTVDGEALPVLALAEARKINPGHHTLTVHVDGGATNAASVDVTEGQTADVSLVAPAPPAGYHREVFVHREKRGGSGLIIVGGVLAGAGVLLGGIAGIIAVGDSNELKNNCQNNVCTTKSDFDLLDTARSAATVATVGFVGAGIGAVLLIIGLATHSSHKDMTALIGPNWAGVSGAF